MDKLQLLISLLYLAVSVAMVIYFFRLCKDVAEIKDLLSFRLEPTKTVLYPAGPEDVRDEAEYEKFCEACRKGDLVELVGFGPCSYEGKWSGKYCFYPKRRKALPDSPFLINDAEPYLALPRTELKNYLKI